MDFKSKYSKILESFNSNLLNTIKKSNSVENLCKILSDHGNDKSNYIIKNACFERIIEIIKSEQPNKYNYDKIISIIPINQFDDFIKYHWDSCYSNNKNENNNEII